MRVTVYQVECGHQKSRLFMDRADARAAALKHGAIQYSLVEVDIDGGFNVLSQSTLHMYDARDPTPVEN